MMPENENEVEENVSEQPKMPKGPMSKKKEYKTIDEFLEDGEYKSIDGFMNILHETEKDKYFMILNDDQLNKEFIYFTYILNGPSDAGPSGEIWVKHLFLSSGNLRKISVFTKKILSSHLMIQTKYLNQN